MTASLPEETDDYQSLNIRITMQASEKMSRRPEPGSGSYGLNAGSVSSNSSSVSQDASYGYPFASLIPAQAGPPSRRHSMTVQHMLNPSDEEPRRSSQSRHSQSSDNDSDGHGANSYRDSNTLSPLPRFHSVNPSRRSGRGQARVNRRGHRRRSRQTSLSSSGSEMGDNGRRAFRKTYTVEETHFIW